jgi:hypothetical protein
MLAEEVGQCLPWSRGECTFLRLRTWTNRILSCKICLISYLGEPDSRLQNNLEPGTDFQVANANRCNLRESRDWGCRDFADCGMVFLWNKNKTPKELCPRWAKPHRALRLPAKKQSDFFLSVSRIRIDTHTGSSGKGDVRSAAHVRMYACMNVRMHACMSVRMYVCTYVRKVGMCVSVCLSVCLSACLSL